MMNTTYAGAGSRFLAALIDGVVLGIVGFVVGMVLGIVMGTGSSASMVNNLVSFVISIAYYVFYQQSQGQTLGKKAMGIRVVTMEGVKPTTMTFFLREIVGKTVSAIILGIGFLMILWDGKKQGLHDKIAGTVVVKA